MNVETTSEADRFRTLYDANHDRVHRLLGRMAGPLDAEDLTQIVFAKAAKPLPLSRTRSGSDPRRLAGLPCARAADARDRDSRHKACESGPLHSSFRRSYSIIAINRMRGFAIYQIGRADPPRFSARVVSQVFDRDQFLGVGIDL